MNWQIELDEKYQKSFLHDEDREDVKDFIKKVEKEAYERGKKEGELAFIALQEIGKAFREQAQAIRNLKDE